LVYAATQIPLGIALDRFGARRVQAVLALSIGLGCAVFAVAEGYLGLALGRIFIGIGIAAALMALLKAHAQWLPKDRAAAVNGWCVGLGGLGGIMATVPVQWALGFTSWRGVFWGVTAIAVASSAWIWRSVSERPPAPGPKPTIGQETLVALQIFTEARFWRTVPAVAFLSAMNFTYQGLWAGPWLRDVAGLNADARAWVLGFYGLGMVAGSFTTGTIVSALQRRGMRPIVPVVGMMLALMLIQGLLAVPLRSVSPLLWALFAFFGSAGVAGYTIIGQEYPPSMAGRISTAMNLCMLVMVFTFQHLIGVILDLFPRTAGGGWDPRGYSWALVMTITLQALSVVWLLVPRKRDAAHPGR